MDFASLAPVLKDLRRKHFILAMIALMNTVFPGLLVILLWLPHLLTEANVITLILLSCALTIPPFCFTFLIFFILFEKENLFPDEGGIDFLNISLIFTALYNPIILYLTILLSWIFRQQMGYWILLVLIFECIVAPFGFWLVRKGERKQQAQKEANAPEEKKELPTESEKDSKE